MKQTAVLLFITLLLFGCTSVSKKGTEESDGAVSKVEIEAEEKKTPETEKKEEQVILEELTLFLKEYSYYADGLLDNYTMFTYRENSTELLKEDLYNDSNFLKSESIFDGEGNFQTVSKYEYGDSGKQL